MVKKLEPARAPDDPEVVDAQLSDIEKKLDRLKSLYESFFMGMEKMPPNSQRRELNRMLLEMQQLQLRKAVLRFRLQTLVQKWSLLTTYWNRTMREIEMGTYRRDLARLQTRMADRGQRLTEEQAIGFGIPSHRAKAFAERHNTRLAARGIVPKDDPPTAPRPTPTARPDDVTGASVDPRREVVPGMSEADVAALYKRYEDAQRRTGDMRGPANVAQLRQLIRKQAPTIMQQHMACGVSFDVAIKEGRVILKAKPLR